MNRKEIADSPVLIRDVAVRAGVSRATVSKALNAATMSVIAPATRERVQRVARELGYHPSAVARGLSRKRMDTVGIIMPPGEASPNDSPFFSVLFDGVVRSAAVHKQNVTLFVGDTWKNAHESLPRFRDGRCDGFLVFYQPEDSDVITALLDVNMPVVLVNDQRDDERLSWVDVDDRESARTMTDYLISLGHQRIALLTDNDPKLGYIWHRVEGYEKAIQMAGLSPRVISVGWNESGDAVVSAIEEILALPEEMRPTALFCTGDSSAGTAISALQQRGVNVPRDISVTGFNDDAAAKTIIPSLTTMRQPYLQIGEKVVSLLLEQVEDRSKRGRQVLLTTELIVRNSTDRVKP